MAEQRPPQQPIENDAELLPDDPTPSAQGSGGAGIAGDLASQEELLRAGGGDDQPVRAKKDGAHQAFSPIQGGTTGS